MTPPFPTRRSSDLRCQDRKPDPAGALAADEGSVGWCQANALFARPPCKLLGAHRRHGQPDMRGAVRHRHLVEVQDALCQRDPRLGLLRSEEHTSELQSLMRISYAVFCLKKKTHRHSHIK